ncbi:RIIA protein [Vibrio phage YC]|uniref:RIIA protein n=1 Tax=Vibrio phage YC TaxID=2267403 RepID=A0A384ZRV3_9CAUD|nr:RIIA lysis inhibitor [Vibrio phage YC]AXC34370.1 RIIA protein [Vibrio phage YC]
MAIQRQEAYHNETNMAGQRFSVKMNGKSFAAMTSTLYTRKGEAVARESICNAQDANDERDRLYRTPVPSHYGSVSTNRARAQALEADAENRRWYAPMGTPVTIQLPTTLDPNYIIEDKGVGLTVDQVLGEVQMSTPADYTATEIEQMIAEHGSFVPEVLRDAEGHPVRAHGIYTTMYGSSKEDSNDQIGAYGLGCKSPFAVSDTFEVEVTKNGERHIFIMYLDNERCPCVTWITKDPETGEPSPIMVDEHNGVKVTIPCQEEYIRELVTGVYKTLRTFPQENQPLIINPNGREVDLISRKVASANTFIQVEDNSKRHYAVQGGVAYPINLDMLEEDLQKVLVEFPFTTYTYFSIGDLNVPPSREALEYDKFTMASLNKALRMGISTDKMTELANDMAAELIAKRKNDIKDGILYFDDMINIRQALQKAFKITGEQWSQILRSHWSKEDIERMRFDHVGTSADDTKIPLPTLKWTDLIEDGVVLEGDKTKPKFKEVEKEESPYELRIYHYAGGGDELSKTTWRETFKAMTLSHVHMLNGVMITDKGTGYVDRLRQFTKDTYKKSGQYSGKVGLLVPRYPKKHKCRMDWKEYLGQFVDSMTSAIGEKPMENFLCGYADEFKPKTTITSKQIKGLSVYTGGLSESWNSWQKVNMPDFSRFEHMASVDIEDFKSGETSTKPLRLVTVPMEGFVPLKHSMNDIMMLHNALRESETYQYEIIAVRAAAEEFVKSRPDLFLEFEDAFQHYFDENMAESSEFREAVNATVLQRYIKKLEGGSSIILFHHVYGHFFDTDFKAPRYRQMLAAKPRVMQRRGYHYQYRSNLETGAGLAFDHSMMKVFEHSFDSLSKKFIENLYDVIDSNTPKDIKPIDLVDKHWRRRILSMQKFYTELYNVYRLSYRNFDQSNGMEGRTDRKRVEYMARLIKADELLQGVSLDVVDLPHDDNYDDQRVNYPSYRVHLTVHHAKEEAKTKAASKDDKIDDKALPKNNWPVDERPVYW